MSIVSIRGGPITHRYLMGKTKDDLARMHMDLLRLYERSQQELVKYARHTDDCGSRRGHDCDCGKESLVERARDYLA